MSGDRIAVVGASAAGRAAAEALRRHGWQGELCLIGAEPHLRVVIVGNGALGSELAATIWELGHEVALVGPASTPMERTLGPCLGALLAQAHAARGVALHGGRRAESLGARGGAVRSVHLDDGTELPADLVLTATGATPATAWLAGTAGLDLTDGVGCDAYCAAGDVARFHPPAPARPHSGRVRSCPVLLDGPVRRAGPGVRAALPRRPAKPPSVSRPRSADSRQVRRIPAPRDRIPASASWFRSRDTVPPPSAPP